MAHCNLLVDDVPVCCGPDATLLEAITAAGASVPTLCHHQSLLPVGACRMCVVEVAWPDGRTALVPSCSTPVADGLEVATRTSAVRRSHRLTLELLLTRAPQSPRIRDLAHQYGLVESRFPALVPPDECVLCGLCVRVCAEQVGREAITFARRSAERTVTAAFGRSSGDCFACGSCVNLCPTGVLRFTDEGDRRRLTLGERLLSENRLERCAVCRRPFATREFLDWVAERSGARADDLVCPSCARRYRAERMVRPLHAS